MGLCKNLALLYTEVGGVYKEELAAVLNFTMCYIHFIWIKAYECISDHDGVVGGKFDDILGCDLAFV